MGCGEESGGGGNDAGHRGTVNRDPAEGRGRARFEMKMEYLPSGSPDCPLIRLYDFTQSEVGSVARDFTRLAAGEVMSVALHDQAHIQCVGGCRLTLKHSASDRGIQKIDAPIAFECELTTDGWQDVSDRARPLTSDSAGEVFQWLDETSDISLLRSRTGRW